MLLLQASRPVCIKTFVPFQVFYSVVSVLHDPKYFEDPSTFKPERFINNQGEFVPDEKVIYFGTGKRRCVGEILGRAEMYIFAAALIKVHICGWREGAIRPENSHEVGYLSSLHS